MKIVVVVVVRATSVFMDSDACISAPSTLTCDVGGVDVGLGLSVHAVVTHRRNRCVRLSNAIKL